MPGMRGYERCALAGVPQSYIETVRRYRDGLGRFDADTLQLWSEGVPADYAGHLCSLPVPIVILYWSRRIPLKDIQSYGIWAMDHDTFIRLNENSVPPDYAVPLLVEGLNSRAIARAYSEGVAMDYMMAVAHG